MSISLRSTNWRVRWSFFGRANPQLNDHVVDRAVEATFQYYRAKVRGHDPKPPALTGLDAGCHLTVNAACERLLTIGARPLEKSTQGNTAPLSLAELVDCLREVHRSVRRRSQQGGRTGYLEFVRQFVG